MQAPTTWTRGHGFHRLTASAIGLTLLAAATLGALALDDRIDLPLIGGSVTINRTGTSTTTTEIEFLEQNSWDYQTPANDATIERVRLIEDNSFDYASPVTAEQMHFLEENIWEREALAQAAGQNAPAVPALSYVLVRFLEENIWETQQLIPPVDTGEANY